MQSSQGSPPQSDAPTPRVLHVVRPAAGGMVSHVRNLTEALAALGVECSIAAPRGTFGYHRSIAVHNVPIAASTNPVRDAVAALKVARLAKRVDIVHGHGIRGGWIASLAAKLARKPYCVTLHNPAPAAVSPIAAAAVQAMLQRAERVIAISRAVADSWSRYGPHAAQTSVIPNGVDTAAFANLPDRAAARDELKLSALGPVVGAFGRLAPEKGFDLLIESFHKVKQAQPNAVLVVAGAGPEESRLRQLTDRLQLADCVRFTGYLQDVRVLLAAANVICVPSRTEGQGLSAVEAMAAGLPVVAFAVGGLCEVVRDSETGVLVEPNSVDALAQALDTVLTDGAATQKMGAAGRQAARTTYQVDDMGRKTLEVYKKVLEP